MSETAENLIRKNKYSRNPFLDLGNCSLNELPETLFSCYWLVGLNLGSTYTNISNLELVKSVNHGTANVFHHNETFNNLKNLSALRHISLNRSYIRNIDFLNNLPQLEVIELNENNIKDYTPLSNIINLMVLSLSGNNIRDAFFLSHITTLQTLIIKSNHLVDIRFLGNLINLKNLNISDNYINDIDSLPKLTSLESINLSANSISNISKLMPFLSRNSQIKVLLKHDDYNLAINLSDNPLSTPPREVAMQGREAIINYFAELNRKGKDYLYEAKMLIVGQPRAGKTSLRNKLFDQKSLLPAEELTTRGIDIQQLSFDIIDRDGNPTKFKYNIWDFGGQHIYYATHQFFLTNRSLYVLVIDTGKDSVGNDDSNINYWLQVIELMSNNSPTLLLMNQKNERQFSYDLSSKKVRFSFFKENYKINLNALIPETVLYNEQQEKIFKEFKKDIETELNRLPLVGFTMPKNWILIRKELQYISSKKPYISRQDYYQICDKHDVKKDEKKNELSHIFHDLGIFLHFQEHSALEEFIILQNTWVTNAVFSVLDSKLVTSNEGKFTVNDLVNIWNKEDYEISTHRKLLELMKQFELCYKVERTYPQAYIVPELLADKSPDQYQWVSKHDVPFQYEYDFMPKGILTRLIVRLNGYIYKNRNGQQIVWKSGVVIDGSLMDCPGTLSEIVEAWDSKKIFVRVQGKFSRDLVIKIMHEIDLINIDFFKNVSQNPTNQQSKYYKMIPCNCHVCKDTVDKSFYDYSKLLERISFGKQTIECNVKPYETVLIKNLLERFAHDSLNIDENINYNAEVVEEKIPKKIFISYSHKDEKEWKDEMVSHLASLRNQGLIESWTDRQIEPGNWDSQIENAMHHADIFLLLITHNFLASNYISSKEITTAYKRYKQGKVMIFPVICDSCAWELQPVTKTEKEYNEKMNKEIYVWLGKFQAFPENASPLKEWTNIHKGFLDVIKKLEKYL